MSSSQPQSSSALPPSSTADSATTTSSTGPVITTVAVVAAATVVFNCRFFRCRHHHRRSRRPSLPPLQQQILPSPQGGDYFDLLRHAILQDEETYTNPIDRTVAHLLFHKTSESCMTPMNDEMRQSRFLCSAVSNLPQNIPESMSEREPEIFGEMELQPSVSM